MFAAGVDPRLAVRSLLDCDNGAEMGVKNISGLTQTQQQRIVF